MKRSPYYEELTAFSDPSMRAGWRHCLEQGLRFEVALEALAGSSTDYRDVSLLDLGCGPGDLRQYLQVSGREAWRYCGIDCFEPSIELANQRFSDATFLSGDFFSYPFDVPHSKLVLAIGTLVDGSAENHRTMSRRERVEALIERAFSLASGVACLVVLQQEMLDTRVAFALDPFLIGAYAHELMTIARRHTEHWVLREDFLQTDYALYLFRDSESHRAYVEYRQGCKWRAHDFVVNCPWGEATSLVDQAWFWLEAGHRARAESILYGESAPRCDRARLLIERLQS